MTMAFPRKADLIELMTTGLGIVEKYEGKWYITHKFRDFNNKKQEIEDVVAVYSVMRAANPSIDERITTLLALLVVWDNDISEEDALEAALFLEYWTAFGICPFDRYEPPLPGLV